MESRVARSYESESNNLLVSSKPILNGWHYLEDIVLYVGKICLNWREEFTVLPLPCTLQQHFKHESNFCRSRRNVLFHSVVWTASFLHLYKQYKHNGMRKICLLVALLFTPAQCIGKVVVLRCISYFLTRNHKRC